MEQPRIRERFSVMNNAYRAYSVFCRPFVSARFP